MTFLDRGGTLAMRVHGRMLVLHEESEYEEWGLGGSITVNPGGGGRGTLPRRTAVLGIDGERGGASLGSGSRGADARRPCLWQPPNRRGSRIWDPGPGGSGTVHALREAPAVGTARRRVSPVGRDGQRDRDDAARCRESGHPWVSAGRTPEPGPGFRRQLRGRTGGWRTRIRSLAPGGPESVHALVGSRRAAAGHSPHEERDTPGEPRRGPGRGRG